MFIVSSCEAHSASMDMRYRRIKHCYYYLINYIATTTDIRVLWNIVFYAMKMKGKELVKRITKETLVKKFTNKTQDIVN